ncbi:MAG: hypothetical protein K2W85_15300 [Phycisphaerales bacterium]|nr:hypothetical protein [Phycisphaerales bacterium]
MTRTRPRSIALWFARLGCVIAIIAAGAWSFSVFRAVMVRHLSANATRPSPDSPGWFEMSVITSAASLLDDRLILSRSGYTSALQDAEKLRAQWQPELGLKIYAFDPQPSKQAWNAWSPNDRRVLGLGLQRDDGGGTGMWHTVLHIPCWFPIVLGAIPIAWYLMPINRRARRRAAGLCEKCGYSRAGVPAESRCPECGCTPQRDA